MMETIPPKIQKESSHSFSDHLRHIISSSLGLTEMGTGLTCALQYKMLLIFAVPEQCMKESN